MTTSVDSCASTLELKGFHLLAGRATDNYRKQARADKLVGDNRYINTRPRTSAMPTSAASTRANTVGAPSGTSIRIIVNAPIVAACISIGRNFHVCY